MRMFHSLHLGALALLAAKLDARMDGDVAVVVAAPAAEPAEATPAAPTTVVVPDSSQAMEVGRLTSEVARLTEALREQEQRTSAAQSTAEAALSIAATTPEPEPEPIAEVEEIELPKPAEENAAAQEEAAPKRQGWIRKILLG